MSMFTADLVAPSVTTPRRAERRPVSAPAQCRRGSSRETVDVLDLSPAGTRVRAVAPLRTGYTVWLKLPGIEAQEARVVWTVGFESGCEFVRPLYPAVFETVAMLAKSC